MPDLSPLFAAGRVLLVAYATTATVLATACLALQALTHFDRRQARRRARRPAVRPARGLFVRLDPELDAP